MNDPIKQTLLARVYDVALETPLQPTRRLANQLGCKVFIKREDLQPIHSFKIRGAYNKIANLNSKQRSKGILTASAGNHAQGVALSARKLGITATIVMPETTPTIKIEAVKDFGGRVVLHGTSYSDAYTKATELAASSGKIFIHPFDDAQVIAGQGTIGRELLEQNPDLTHIFVPVGGGGLIAGIAQYVKALRPSVVIVGVEPEDSNAMQTSLRAGKPVRLNHVGIFADGVAVKQVGIQTFKIAQQHVDTVITVTNDQICAGIKAIFEETRTIAEPAGALAAAGLLAYAENHNLTDAQVAVICSGANISFERLQYVAERTLLGSGTESLFSIKLDEHPGALQELCAKVIRNNSITQFSYRHSGADTAGIFIGVAFVNAPSRRNFMDSLRNHKYEYQDFSADDLAKDHVRYMVGGKASAKLHELLYEVSFPERPGALGNFLQALGSQWNITLFHYRGLGSDTGKVLIGFDAVNQKILEKALQQTGYESMPARSKVIQDIL